MNNNTHQLPFSGKQLKELRRATKPKLTQEKMAEHLGICRETVVAIENEIPGAIRNLQINMVLKWYKVCQGSIDVEKENKFLSYVKSFFNIS